MNEPVVVAPVTLSPSRVVTPVTDTSYITAALRPSIVKDVLSPETVAL
jgi:hypothetical protein